VKNLRNPGWAELEKTAFMEIRRRNASKKPTTYLFMDYLAMLSVA
jgi:hypothetical protein